ncbi:MFS transporter [Paracoccus caeni]|uniref:MFS transporter n=1 Tax=Paracoccus caeni TaxID=657651 RepID=A0A934SLB2_9RHOB|nr:MFS transporter [Paracoccus caeni]MBK4217342.1 MFS transporter [Paracoccus caeni]
MTDAKSTPNPWAATAVLLLGNFMNLIDISIVNVGLPSIQRNLNASATEIEWVSAAYVLAFAVALLPSGRFGDKLGRKKMFLWGVALFTLASALCGFAWDMDSLIAARALQGIGGAMMVPQVMAIIHVMFPPDQKARAFAMAGFVISLGAVTGPLLGGVLITWDIGGLDWRPIFLVNLPVGIFVILVGSRLIPALGSDRGMRIDWFSVALFGLVILMIVLPLIEGALLGWPLWCILMMLAAVPMAALFLWRQFRLQATGRAQLLPVQLLKSGAYVSGVAMVMLHFSTIPSMFLILAIYLQTGFGLDPLQSGIATAPFPIGVMIGSFIAGRFGANGLALRMAIGVLVLLAGMALLRYQGGHPPQPFDMLAVMPPLFLCGLGGGLLISPMFQLVLLSVPGRDAGAGTGAMQAFQQVGVAVGIAIVSGLFFVRLHEQPGDGYAPAFGHALTYQLFAYTAVLAILAVRSWFLARQPEPKPISAD